MSLNLYKFTLRPLLDFHHHGEALKAPPFSSVTLPGYQFLFQVGEGGIFVGMVSPIHQVLAEYH